MTHATTKPVILITGGSRGMGAATARLAAERGYDVAFSYLRDAAAADSVAADIAQRGARPWSLCGNSTCPLAGVQRPFRHTPRRSGCQATPAS
jgi:NAD(P)-dependent dehydrogenase (short-subunit alcohol dehydrogenase family)